MFCKRLYPILGLLLLQLSFTHPAGAVSSTDGTYTLQRSTFGSVAAKSSDGSTFQMTYTAGQSVASDSMLDGNNGIDAGFWKGSLLPVAAGDLNDDGRVELADIVYGMHGLTAQVTPAINDADVNNDGKIDPAELIHIMRVQAQLTE